MEKWRFLKDRPLILILLICIAANPEAVAQCDTAWIVYPASNFCQNESDPKPIILGTLSGTFTSNTNLSLDPSSGKIDLSTSIPGTYGISYATSGPCPDTTIEIIEIHPADNAWFQYNGPICENSPNPIPTVAVSGGRFTSLSGALTLVDPFTGEIDLDSTDAGTHLTRYTTNGACPSDSDKVLTVQVSPNPGFLIPDSTQTFCEGDPVSVLAFGGEQYAFYLNDSLLRGLSDNANYNLPMLPENGDELRVRAVNANGECEASDTISLHISDSPQLTNLDYPQTISNPTDLEIFLVPDADNTVINWAFDVEGIAEPMDSTGKTPPLQAGSFWRLNEGPITTSPIDPVQIHYTLRPESNGCFGPTDSFAITILPSQDGVFIPSVITPNGNGQNDTWEIRYASGINPDEYSLQVFNRSGGLVYEQKGLNGTWDGAGLASGTYWYVAYRNNEVFQADGLYIQRGR